MELQQREGCGPGTKAIIYCRVSDTKQTTRGDGLNSQETRCREFAKYKGYEVVSVFKDDMSGRFHARPGMQAALAFLRKHRKSPHVLIIDDITRARAGGAYQAALGHQCGRGHPRKPVHRVRRGLGFNSGRKPAGFGLTAPASEEWRAN